MKITILNQNLINKQTSMQNITTSFKGKNCDIFKKENIKTKQNSKKLEILLKFYNLNENQQEIQNLYNSIEQNSYKKNFINLLSNKNIRDFIQEQNNFSLLKTYCQNEFNKFTISNLEELIKSDFYKEISKINKQDATNSLGKIALHSHEENFYKNFNYLLSNNLIKEELEKNKKLNFSNMVELSSPPILQNGLDNFIKLFNNKEIYNFLNAKNENNFYLITCVAYFLKNEHQ